MYEVTITGWFAAAHQLRLADGEVEPLHGHNWRVAATFAGPELDKLGLLLDFTTIKPRLDEILAALHDRNLNDSAMFKIYNPSAENIATHIATQLTDDLPAGVSLTCVEVEEAPGCVARYRPAGR